MQNNNESSFDDDALLRSISNTKYNNEGNLDKEIIFYNYIPHNEGFTINKMEYFNEISKTEEKIKKKTLKNIKNFLNLEKNPLNIIPSCNNIDLKKRISPKLQYLNELTDIAIQNIIKETKAQSDK